MKVLININDFNKIINDDGLSIILIGSSTCNPCKALANRIDEFLLEYRDIKGIYIPIECFKEDLANLGILSIPTVLVYAEGKLQVKESGYFSLDKILNNIIRIKELME